MRAESKSFSYWSEIQTFEVPFSQYAYVWKSLKINKSKFKMKGFTELAKQGKLEEWVEWEM